MSKIIYYDILQLDKMNKEELYNLANWWGIDPTSIGKQQIMYAILDKQLEYKNLHIKELPEEEDRTNRTVTMPVKFPKRKIHRNEPCSCGSGLKYKNCCEKKMMGLDARHYHAKAK